MARTSIVRSVLTLLGGIVALVVIIGGILVVGFDLRVELAGGGLRPIFSFGSTEDHYATVERNRSQHYSRLLPAGPPPAPDPETDTSIEAGASGPPTSTRPENASVEARDDAYWTDFRGPNRDGHYTQMSIRTDWPAAGLEPVWSQPIGGGYASFVVAQGRAFTIEQRHEQEVVAAYDLATGRELWTHVWDADFREPMGGPGPRATPTWHAGRIYALGATGRFWCLEADTGDVIWERDILSDSQATNLTWAMSAAPLVVDDLVVVQPGGGGGMVARRLQLQHRRRRLAHARRRPGVHVADDGDTGRCATGSHRDCGPRGGPRPTRWPTPVGTPMGCGAAPHHGTARPHWR